MCWRGLAGVRPNVRATWDAEFDREGGDLPATELCLWFNKGHSETGRGRNSAHAVAGRHGGDIASVVIEGTVQGRVEPSTVDGWFLAWWPGHEEGPTSFRVMGLDGAGQPVTDLVAARDAQDEDWPCSSD